MEALQPKLSEVVKKERKELELTFEDFSKLCGVSVRTAKSAEYGKFISHIMAKKMLDTLGYEMIINVELKKIKKD